MARIFDTPLYAFQHHADQDADAPARHGIVIVGAGPVGLSLAIDLGQNGVPVVVLDDNDKVADGSRAICFSQRTLEIADRLGCGHALRERGLEWSTGKVFVDDREVFRFGLQPETAGKYPAFLNVQQYRLEEILLQRLRELQQDGAPIDLRGQNKVSAIGQHENHSILEIDTPEGSYNLQADWLVACDGARSSVRRMLGLAFSGTSFSDNFLIADVKMAAEYPSERLFWFDPAFNRGRAALLHRQPDDLWRIDLQLGPEEDPDEVTQPENLNTRLKGMLGENAVFEVEWASVHKFQCRRLEAFMRGHIIFAGDAAHQVSPFGARGANSGIQDADNLGWKLKLVTEGKAPAKLLESYQFERMLAADENISHSWLSTQFVSPKTKAVRRLRDAVLDLSEEADFARQLVNSGRLSTPCTYDGSPLNSADTLVDMAQIRPGAALADIALKDGYLLEQTGNRFVLLAIDAELPDSFSDEGIDVDLISLRSRDDTTGVIARELKGEQASVVFLIRPDQHIAARRVQFDEKMFRSALRRATAREIA